MNTRRGLCLIISLALFTLLLVGASRRTPMTHAAPSTVDSQDEYTVYLPLVIKPGSGKGDIAGKIVDPLTGQPAGGVQVCWATQCTTTRSCPSSPRSVNGIGDEPGGFNLWNVTVGDVTISIGSGSTLQEYSATVEEDRTNEVVLPTKPVITFNKPGDILVFYDSYPSDSCPMVKLGVGGYVNVGWPDCNISSWQTCIAQGCVLAKGGTVKTYYLPLYDRMYISSSSPYGNKCVKAQTWGMKAIVFDQNGLVDQFAVTVPPPYVGVMLLYGYGDFYNHKYNLHLGFPDYPSWYMPPTECQSW